MSPLLWLAIGAAYPVSVLASVRWLEAVQADWREENRLPNGIAILSPLVLVAALAWLLLFSHRKAGGK